jgi:hypothetical protein
MPSVLRVITSSRGGKKERLEASRKGRCFRPFAAIHSAEKTRVRF